MINYLQIQSPKISYKSNGSKIIIKNLFLLQKISHKNEKHQ
jgi:hypothetical protein